MSLEFVQPEGWEAPRGYSNGVSRVGLLERSGRTRGLGSCNDSV
jgi:hypothetical protein